MNKILKYILIILIYLVIILFQLYFANDYLMFGYTVNLFIVLIVISIFNFGIEKSIIFSIGLGILIDILYLTNGFGYYTFTYGIVAFVISMFIIKTGKKNILQLLLFLFIATAIFEVIEYGKLAFVYGKDLGIMRLFIGIILSYILNIAPTLAIHFILDKLNKRINKNSIRGMV